MSSGSVGKGKDKSKSRVEIPDFLQPFVNQATGVASSALTGLQRGIGSGSLVAPFTPTQELAQRLGIGRALGEGDFFSTAQDTMLDAARGQGVESFLPEASFDALTSSAGGQGLESFLDPAALQALRSGTQGDPTLESILGRSAVPGASTDVLTELSQGRDLEGTDILSQLASQGVIPDASRSALESTASGDFLFGGEGFDAAVEAAVRAAQPGIISAFGRSGAGGATGGLSRAAVGQAGVDAFARQFANERGNQLSAANALAGLELTDAGRRGDVASTLAGLDLEQGSQRAGAAGLLGELGLSETGQDADIASVLANLRQGSAGALADLGSQERGRGLTSAGILAELGLTERGNQLDAAASLPELAEADIGLLDRIGASQQELEQLRRSAPIDAQMQLLQAALAGLPISSFLGQNTSGKRSGFSLGFS